MSSGPSGRSPFTGRSRRQRTSYGSTNADTSAEDASMTSPFLSTGGLLSSGRLSPAAAAGWSPAATAVNSRRRRFFDDRSRVLSDGGVLATGIPPPPPSTGRGNRKAPEEQTKSLVDGMDLVKLRSLAQEALGNSAVTASPGMAVFCGSILYSKTLQAEDAYLYAQALSRDGEFRRCVCLLDKADLLRGNNFEAVLLAAQSLASLSEWEECLAVLEDATGNLEDEDEGGWKTLVSSQENDSTKIHPIARLCLWRGKAYDETSHPTRAALFWKRALLVDARCVEALDSMLKRSVVTPQEAHDLLSRLQFDSGLEWLRNVYLARLDLPQEIQKENKEPNSFFGGQHVDASSIQHMTMTPSSGTVLVDNIWEVKEDDPKPSAKKPASVENTTISHNVDAAFSKLWTVHKLHQSPEVLSLAAIRSYRRYNLPAALSYCQALTNVDPLCPTASYVYVATLVGLNKKRLLFGLAHEWVEASPKAARSWFAVGAYYYACKRYHVAQRHFCRATRLDPHATEAWIAFGCSFAACDESDQALASFRAAQRLAPAQHSSLLYMGMEYLRTNHLVLAQHFLTAALRSSGGDPLCYHELGVAAWNKKEYKEAIVCFGKSLRTSVETSQQVVQLGEPVYRPTGGPKTTTECIDLVQDAFWEPTLFNLGQCYRKTRHFAEAEHCFEKCLALCPVSCDFFFRLCSYTVIVHSFIALCSSCVGQRIIVCCFGFYKTLDWQLGRCH